MRKQLAIALTCLTFTACTIRPAPTIDLHAPGALGLIKERRTYLEGEKRKLDFVLIGCSIGSLIVGGTTYLIQRPARKKIRSEIIELTEEEKIIKEIVDHDANAKMEK